MFISIFKCNGHICLAVNKWSTEALLTTLPGSVSTPPEVLVDRLVN
eukprot:SAG25_NODE_34_length_20232_cov_4.725534_16_plen_46_part_00